MKAAAQLLQLDNYLDRRPRDLSGGQRQRVAMGRAIVREPAVFLFDEPLSNLDAKLRVQMRLEISELHKRLETTMVYVTHDQVEAMTMADKIVVLQAGMIEQVGTPLELYRTPRNIFVAGFIGSPKMNLIVGNEAAKYVAGKSITVQTSAKGEAIIGIRPEHVIADESGPMSITVRMGEPLGANTLLHGQLNGTETAFTASLPGVHHATPGQVVRFSANPKNMHFFNIVSGKRI